MAGNHLAAYLNDHLAGSVMAVDLLTQLEETHAGTEIARVFTELRADIEADRRELKSLMNKLEIAESRPRKVTAWLTAVRCDYLKAWKWSLSESMVSSRCGDPSQPRPNLPSTSGESIMSG